MSIQEHASNARCVRNFRYPLIQFQYQVDISGRCLDLCLQLLFPWKVLLLMCGVNFVAKQQTTVAVVYTSSMFLVMVVVGFRCTESFALIEHTAAFTSRSYLHLILVVAFRRLDRSLLYLFNL